MNSRIKFRTYSHLQPLQRIPSEYDIVTTDILYYPKRGFEVRTPLGVDLEDQARKFKFKNVDWEVFADPRATTYSKYTEIQARQEAAAAELCETFEDEDYYSCLSESWRGELFDLLSALRFPCHALQMTAAYVGSLAPAGRLVITSMFQAADEMRRIQRLAYCKVLMQRLGGEVPIDQGKELWLKDPRWQPLRRLMEQLLVTYDWEEALVALQYAVKPLFDGVFLSDFRRYAMDSRDIVWSRLLRGLEEDSRWHADWSRELLILIYAAHPENESLVETWKSKWISLSKEALFPWKQKFRPVTE